LHLIFYRVLFQFHNLTKGRLQRSEKELIVLKNNQPSAIILSPEEYTRLTEIEEDYFLLLEANKRLDDNGNKETVSYDSVMKHLGIGEAELLEAEDADIE
jgi:antitoxin StbD